MGRKAVSTGVLLPLPLASGQTKPRRQQKTTMASSRVQRLTRARDNYEYILVLLTQAIAEPTNRAAIDAVIAAADNLGLPRPMIDNSADGISQSWTSYQQMVSAQIKALDELIQRAEGPWEVRTRPIF